jgi:hypothetical protein
MFPFDFVIVLFDAVRLAVVRFVVIRFTALFAEVEATRFLAAVFLFEGVDFAAPFAFRFAFLFLVLAAFLAASLLCALVCTILKF